MAKALTSAASVLHWDSDGRLSFWLGRHRLDGGTPSSSRLVREFGPSETVARSLAATDARRSFRAARPGNRKGARTKRIRVPARGRRRTDSTNSPPGGFEERIPKFRQRNEAPECRVRRAGASSIPVLPPSEERAGGENRHPPQHRRLTVRRPVSVYQTMERHGTRAAAGERRPLGFRAHRLPFRLPSPATASAPTQERLQRLLRPGPTLTLDVTAAHVLHDPGDRACQRMEDGPFSYGE